MFSGKLKIILLVLAVSLQLVSGQGNVPLGIHYQAVARDNYGKELINEKIDVRFSIISENPDGQVEYMEVHSNVITSKFGVFSLIIGRGLNAGGLYTELSQVEWSKALHFLKVEVKFDNDYVNMGTMQFMAVPYALYAQKSLEPGPPGPQGLPGDPATDDQKLSFDGKTLSIDRGNSVNLAIIESDGDPKNEIQEITISSDKLKIDKNPDAREWDLTRYLDNKDEQRLKWDPVKRRLGISGDTVSVGLSELKNDADADPTNEIQSLTYDTNTGDLSISDMNTINLYSSIGFKAKKIIAETGLAQMVTYPFVNVVTEFVDGLNNGVPCYSNTTGNFTAPATGIYTFFITFKAEGSGSARILTLLKNGSEYEVLGPDIVAGTELVKWVTMKLNSGDIISLTINTGTSNNSGTGSFVGYKVN